MYRHLCSGPVAPPTKSTQMSFPAAMTTATTQTAASKNSQSLKPAFEPVTRHSGPFWGPGSGVSSQPTSMTTKATQPTAPAVSQSFFGSTMNANTQSNNFSTGISSQTPAMAATATQPTAPPVLRSLFNSPPPANHFSTGVSSQPAIKTIAASQPTATKRSESPVPTTVVITHSSSLAETSSQVPSPSSTPEAVLARPLFIGGGFNSFSTAPTATTSGFGAPAPQRSLMSATAMTVACQPPSRGYRPTKPPLDLTFITIHVSDRSVLTLLSGITEFEVPQEYLTAVSEHFEKVFNDESRDPDETELTTTDVASRTFRVFYEWLNGRKLVNEDGEEYTYKKGGHHFDDLIDLYIFATKYDIPQLRHDVMNAWIRCQAFSPEMCSYAHIAKAYEMLPAGSPMLRSMVDSSVASFRTFYTSLSAEKRMEELKELPKEFLYDKMVKLVRDKEGGFPRSPYKDDCRYHEHD
ncbi:hypothetical protein EJ08DRAFT_712223 [Tothia fuscella]|uniref:BTB domain-containing protein n=1 Tax=Tothia fuscella TaxID=1048955 RepID=A0A9P4NUX4_9PEZI|nr:hypothetical protein EJ08DRAFT_712223 [Tothia fuscella]